MDKKKIDKKEYDGQEALSPIGSADEPEIVSETAAATEPVNEPEAAKDADREAAADTADQAADADREAAAEPGDDSGAEDEPEHEFDPELLADFQWADMEPISASMFVEPVKARGIGVKKADEDELIPNHEMDTSQKKAISRALRKAHVKSRQEEFEHTQELKREELRKQKLEQKEARKREKQAKRERDMQDRQERKERARKEREERAKQKRLEWARREREKQARQEQKARAKQEREEQAEKERWERAVREHEMKTRQKAEALVMQKAEARAVQKDETQTGEAVEEQAVQTDINQAARTDGNQTANTDGTQTGEESEKQSGKNDKERSEKRSKKKRKQRSVKMRIFIWLIRIMFLIFFACIATGVGYIIYVDHTSKDIDPHNIYANLEMSSFLYDADGHEIDKIFYSEDRELISIDEIPDDTKNAFIAIEDKTFYKHHGFNFRRMVGAVISKLLGRSAEISGTSTITQQLARNVFLSDVKSQRTIRRKVSEMLYAWEIERTLSKDEILEAYLNTIYLGYGNYGVVSAARSYFDKDVRDLTLAESAALAALPQAPDSYALIKNEKEDGLKYLKKYDVYANDASRERRYLVLDLMAEQEYITQEEADEAKVKIKKILHPHQDDRTSEFTYFTDYVIEQVAEDLADKYRMTSEEALRVVYTGGLSIHTTVEPEIQKIVNDEFANDYNFPWAEETPQAAMVITEVGTGRIRAMVGGRGGTGKKLFNRATSPRQPGSTIKPLTVYSAALQKSYEYAENGQTFQYLDYGYDYQGTKWWGDYITASSYVSDERMYVNGTVWPQNFSRRFTGRQTFRTALQQSINTCAVKIQLQVGATYSMDLLKKYGVTTAVDDSSEPVNDLNSAAMALGAMTYGISPLEMAEAYAVFPNGGVRCEPVCYTEVTDANGKVLLKEDPKPTRVLNEGVAYIMTDCLKSVVSRGIAYRASIYGVQVGGKTGTTNDTADIWFCGFVPKYSAALWIGTDHNSMMSTTSQTAAVLWSRIMGQIPDVTEGQYKDMPSNVTYTYGEYYTAGTEPVYGYYRR